jgi:hypothetical protein
MKHPPRSPSKTRVVSYAFQGMDAYEAEKLLKACPAVTQFDFSARGEHFVWFNGIPGEELRAVRDKIAALPGAVQVPREA